MKIEKLPYFIDLYETRSYTKTARNNYISQTSVTQFINSLEEELQVKLFDRTTLPIQPTAAGTRFYQDAKALLRQYQRIKEGLAALDRNAALPVRLCYTSKIDLQILLPFVTGFKTRHPDVAVPETMKILAENYYASAFQGEMGSEDFNKALQDWLDAQTGGLLTDQTQGLEMKPATVLALATTIYFQAKWQTEFSPEATAPGTFHAGTRDLTCDFMRSSTENAYCWGENFGAVGLPLGNDGGTMWIVLPDEGQDVEGLLDSQEVMDFLLSKGSWENQKRLTVNLSLPKFDISAQQDLCQGFENLGLSEVFTGTGDFSPMTTQVQDIALTQATHGVRVAIDEEGVSAAAYTLMALDGSTMPVEDEIDFVVDRPFLFSIVSPDGLPLFVGIVHQPA